MEDKKEKRLAAVGLGSAANPDLPEVNLDEISDTQAGTMQSGRQFEGEGVGAGQVAAGGVSNLGAIGTGAAAATAIPLAYKLGRRGINLARQTMQPGGAFNPIGSTPTATAPATGPVKPTSIPVTSAGPSTGTNIPVNRAAVQPSMTKQVAQMAFNRIAPAIKSGVGMMALATPGNVGQKYPFPQSGPMQGREINPMTGQPWRPEELQAYYASQGR